MAVSRKKEDGKEKSSKTSGRQARVSHKVYYSPAYCDSGFNFDTTRKAAWIADAIRRDPDVDLVEPTLATEDQLLSVHSHEYVEAVRTGIDRGLASTQGFDWDKRLYPAVCASTGGVIAAAREAERSGIAGSLSSGLHHARRDRGKGFCTFNGLVVAARDAVSRGRRVLILDLDAHCGGGTASLIYRDVRIDQLDISVDSFDYYPGAIVVDEPDEYLEKLRGGLDFVPPDVDLVLYNAGVDVHERDCGPNGFDMQFIANREALVFHWAATREIPLAYVLAGGYTTGGLSRSQLVAMHRCTVMAASISRSKGVPCHL